MSVVTRYQDGDIAYCQVDNVMYLIQNQTRRPVSREVFDQFGFVQTRTDPNCLLLFTLPMGDPVRGWTEGTIVADCSGRRYQIRSGRRRPLPPDVDLSLFRDVNLDPIICPYVERIPRGPALQMADLEARILIHTNLPVEPWIGFLIAILILILIIWAVISSKYRRS